MEWVKKGWPHPHGSVFELPLQNIARSWYFVRNCQDVSLERRFALDVLSLVQLLALRDCAPSSNDSMYSSEWAVAVHDNS